MQVPALLLVLGLTAAWRPAETAPATAPLVAAAVLALTPWAWRRTSPEAARAGIGCLVVLVLWLLGCGLAGPDPGNCLTELMLGGGVLAVIWLASRQPPPETHLRLMALGIAALSLWAVWQVAVGFDAAIAAVAELPTALREAVLERLESRRAFASLPLPGHLAALCSRHKVHAR